MSFGINTRVLVGQVVSDRLSSNYFPYNVYVPKQADNNPSLPTGVSVDRSIVLAFTGYIVWATAATKPVTAQNISTLTGAVEDVSKYKISIIDSGGILERHMIIENDNNFYSIHTEIQQSSFQSGKMLSDIEVRHEDNPAAILTDVTQNYNPFSRLKFPCDNTSEIICEHNLGRRVVPIIEQPSGYHVIAQVQTIDDNSIRVIFDPPFTGTIYI